MQQQAVQLARLRSDNEQFSNLAALASSPSANTQDELLRLRGQVAALRQQTNGLAALREEDRRLQASLRTAQIRTNSAFFQPEGLLEEARMRTGFGKQLALALMQYASDHREEFPTNFAAAAAYLSKLTGSETNLTPDQFEIVYRGTRDALSKYAHPGDILLLREKQPWKTTAGQWAKVYAFVNGAAMPLCAADGRFETWEKERIIPPTPAKE